VRRLRPAIVLLVSAAVVVPAAVAAHATTLRPRVVLTQQGQVTRQDIPSRGKSEPDTVVEPDVAVDPLNSNIAVAAAHDSRYSDGGAVGISVAWTSDGGASWHHKPAPGITKAAGGIWDRASDPVLAFGPDGTAYLSVLAFTNGCATAVVVLRSHDGGQTWSKPFYADRRTSCGFSDDKNWIVVDRHRSSPHYGRIYQFWTPFISNGNKFIGDPQAVRWSDDHATTWSTTHFLTAKDRGTQNSQPMILPNGHIVDTFYDYGQGQRSPDAAPGGVTPEASGATRQQRHAFVAPRATINASGPIESVISTDGGATWSPENEVVNNAGGYADGVRCCLFGADIDAVTHRMYVAYEGGVGDTDPVYLTYSDNGTDWSSPIRVSRGDVSGVQRVNVDVVARAGRVYVGYGTRTKPAQSGGFVQQQLSTSTDGGLSFGAPVSIGPRSVLKYAARSEGYFPGDYIGEAIAPGRIFMVWAVSSKPPAPSSSKYHQVIYGATLRP
jgi:hypothetical protein